jgi:hypothetical protein
LSSQQKVFERNQNDYPCFQEGGETS